MARAHPFLLWVREHHGGELRIGLHLGGDSQRLCVLKDGEGALDPLVAHSMHGCNVVKGVQRQRRGREKHILLKMI